MSFLEKYNSIMKAEKELLKFLKDCLFQKKVFDVSPKDLIVIDAVGNKNLTVGELGNYSSMFYTNPSYSIKKLYKNGYIKKNSVLNDKRVCIIELTEKATNLLKDTYCKYKELHA